MQLNNQINVRYNNWNDIFANTMVLQSETKTCRESNYSYQTANARFPLWLGTEEKKRSIKNRYEAIIISKCRYNVNRALRLKYVIIMRMVYFDEKIAWWDNILLLANITRMNCARSINYYGNQEMWWILYTLVIRIILHWILLLYSIKMTLPILFESCSKLWNGSNSYR